MLVSRQSTAEPALWPHHPSRHNHVDRSSVNLRMSAPSCESSGAPTAQAAHWQGSAPYGFSQSVSSCNNPQQEASQEQQHRTLPSPVSDAASIQQQQSIPRTLAIPTTNGASLELAVKAEEQAASAESRHSESPSASYRLDPFGLRQAKLPSSSVDLQQSTGPGQEAGESHATEVTQREPGLQQYESERLTDRRASVTGPQERSNVADVQRGTGAFGFGTSEMLVRVAAPSVQDNSSNGDVGQDVVGKDEDDDAFDDEDMLDGDDAQEERPMTAAERTAAKRKMKRFR